MIVLNSRELEECISPADLIAAVEKAMVLYEGDDFHMPDRMHATFRGDILLLMPAFNLRGFGTKLVSVFPGNQEKGIPVIQGTMNLNDGDSGKPLAIMDAGKLTAMRTGAVGAAGVRHLSSRGASRLGIIGTGVQAWYLASLSCSVREIKEVFVTDLDLKKAEHFAEKLEKKLEGGSSTRVMALEHSTLVLEASEIIITATTSLQPVLPADPSLLKGRTYIGIGSFTPEMREYPKELYQLLESVYIDSRLAPEESGDLYHALGEGLLRYDQVRTLGSFIRDPIEYTDGSTRFFKSVGMGLFDLFVGQKIHETALEKGIGTSVDFP